MNRRKFFRLAGLSSAALITLPQSFNVFSAQADYAGKLLVTIQAEGGWDVTSFCDPKKNVAGESKINQWADNGEIQQAGNINYAPVGNNAAFFNKYYKDMLVINGIDAQTNSHTAGVVHNWSGRISEGFPSLTALHAAVHAPDLPISYINNGGYSHTSDLIRFTRLDDVNNLRNIIFPNEFRWNKEVNFLHQQDWDIVTQHRMARLARQSATQNMTVRQKLSNANYQHAISNTSLLSGLATTIESAGELQQTERSNVGGSSLKRQVQLSLLAMKSGVSSAADLVLGGFDTHDDNDARHEWLLNNLTSSIDYLWQYAEQLNIADRLLVVVMSDFGRTPFYNDTNGKDHWPIGSAIIMEKGASWGNKVIGKTDEGHNALKINAQNFLEDNSNGTIIYPKHVMAALRDYLNVASSELSVPFNLSNTESFHFFS